MTSGGSGDLLLFANKDGQLHGQDKVFPIIQFLFFALLPCHVPNIFSQTCADFWRAVVLDQLFKLEEKIHASASHLLLCVKQTENAENMSLFEAPFDGGWRVRFKHYLENVTDKLPRQTDRAALGRALEEWEHALRENLPHNPRQLVEPIISALKLESTERMTLELLQGADLVQERWNRMIPGHRTSLAHFNRDHWGSKEQTLAGRIISDALHLPAPLGCLFAPTAGILGPSNGPCRFYYLAQRKLSPKCLERHTSIHDACGFLWRTFHIGPGYTYLAPGAPLHPKRGGQWQGHLYMFSWDEDTMRRWGQEPLA